MLYGLHYSYYGCGDRFVFASFGRGQHVGAHHEPLRRLLPFPARTLAGSLMPDGTTILANRFVNGELPSVNCTPGIADDLQVLVECADVPKFRRRRNCGHTRLPLWEKILVNLFRVVSRRHICFAFPVGLGLTQRRTKVQPTFDVSTKHDDIFQEENIMKNIMIRQRERANLGKRARRIIATALTFFCQNFVWAVCADGSTLHQSRTPGH